MMRFLMFVAALLLGANVAGCEGTEDSRVDLDAGLPIDGNVQDTIDDLSDANEPDDFDELLSEVTISNYPRVDGSTSNIPLALVIACELLGMPWKWADAWDEENGDFARQVVPDPKNAEQELLAEAIMAKIVHYKTHKAYMRLIDDEVDFILVASLPSPEEAQHALDVGVELKATPIALDALVFLVNEANPVEGLTADQVRQIFMGNETQWGHVGGPEWSIVPYVRPPNSGSQQLMETVVMAGRTMPAWPEDHQAGSMGGLINMVKRDEAAIGYSVYYYITHMVDPAGMKMIAVDGAAPKPDTIRSRSYPFTAEVWAVTRTNLAPKSLAAQLRDWLTTPAGQQVVAMSEYVTVTD